LDQGLLVLRVAMPEDAGNAVPDWPLGSKNLALVNLRTATFGSHVHGWVSCPQCSDMLEFDFDADELWRSESQPSEVEVGGQTLPRSPP
jgi:hypothetical protein